MLGRVQRRIVLMIALALLPASGTWAARVVDPLVMTMKSVMAGE